MQRGNPMQTARISLWIAAAEVAAFPCLGTVRTVRGEAGRLSLPPAGFYAFFFRNCFMCSRSQCALGQMAVWTVWKMNSAA